MTATMHRTGTPAAPPARHGGFGRALRAEWVKFRTVRGWVIAIVLAIGAIIALGLAPGGGQGSCNVSSCTGPLGPAGEQVTDSFYFVHQQLDGNGSITVQMTSLTGQIPDFSKGGGPRNGGIKEKAGLVPWAKAGIIIKASTRQGSAYAAMMVTGSHGVRMQYDYTGDTPGMAGTVTAATPRWLRQGGPSQATGVFEQVTLAGGWAAAGGWTGTAIGAAGGRAAGSPGGFQETAGRFTVTGTGDIAPSVSGAAGIGVTIAQTLIGVFAGLIVITVVGAMFMTSEYRRDLIRVTLTAIPRRGRVLAAKAAVMAAVAFTSGLAAAAVVVTEGQRVLRDSGVYVWPVTTLTEIRVIVGTAAVLAVASVIAVAAGTIARRSASAVAAVIVVIVLPYLLTVAVPILPVGAADWVARISPAAAFAVQQTVTQYPQVDNVYAPSAGYFPLPPWAGFAVLCGWAALALILAAWALHRRDV